jgi:hypothetical protein
MLLRIIFERFTAFDHLEAEFSPGINIFIGKNGTGKTHILKALYAASDITRSQKSLGEKITRVFLPSGEQTGRLVKRSAGSSRGSVGIYRRIEGRKEEIAIQLSLSNHTRSYESARTTGDLKQWMEAPLDSAYIPVKDMMANAPGFRSLYNMRHIHQKLARRLPVQAGGGIAPPKELYVRRSMLWLDTPYPREHGSIVLTAPKSRSSVVIGLK